MQLNRERLSFAAFLWWNKMLLKSKWCPPTEPSHSATMSEFLIAFLGVSGLVSCMRTVTAVDAEQGKRHGRTGENREVHGAVEMRSPMQLGWFTLYG
ncbi:hypothetical protein DPEC_G00042230 [Dallia pectoralis]|uniref:Uncharacterized protein n=1 Tax=Dallia pectoralis TaxID=75939 RepID=A0ACC2H9E7_DALPE|nr:hypothetical protein DPEC_G00042230 [Dallia pectoralis]